MATKVVTVSLDENVTAQAEAILDGMGMSISGLLDVCLKAVIRERKIPDALTLSAHDRYIVEKLEESLAEAADPSAKWYTHEEIFGPLREKYDYEV